MSLIGRKIKSHFEEVNSSIKLRDIEEWFDIYFSRFFGLYFAKIGRFYGWTPTEVSLMSLVVGIIGGVMLYYQDDLRIVGLGSFLIVLAGILDSSDGQLARMTGQSTELGRNIDGLIDNFVFIAVYLGGSLYFLDSYGWWIFGLTFVAAYTHSLKAALYEFYKSEYLQLVGKSKEVIIPLTTDSMKPRGDKWYHRIINAIDKDYTGKQLRYTTRSKEWRATAQKYSKNENTRSKLEDSYRTLNKPLLTRWALVCGTNTHRTTAIVFAMMARFDLFLLVSAVWTIALVPLSLSQKKRDNKLFELME